MEILSVPGSVAQDCGKDIHRAGHIVQIVIERRKAESQHVGRAEIADDPSAISACITA